MSIFSRGPENLIFVQFSYTLMFLFGLSEKLNVQHKIVAANKNWLIFLLSLCASPEPGYLLSEWIKTRKRNMFIVSSWFVKEIYIRELSLQLSYYVEATRTGCFEISSDYSWDKHQKANSQPTPQGRVLDVLFRNISHVMLKCTG